MVCPAWLSFILYNPLRKLLTDREGVLAESGVTEGSVVLEVGAGNGFFTEVLARVAGKVYAVELQDAMVDQLARRIAGYSDRVEILLGDIAELGYPEGFADVAFLYYSFHEIDRKAEGAANIARAVRPGGILAIYEPTIEVTKKAMERTRGIFEGLGFRTEARRDGLFTRFLRMRKERDGS